MYILLRSLVALAFTTAIAGSAHAQEASGRPRVAIETGHGRMVVELWPESAPETVENFLGYVERGDYDGSIFHRVLPGYIIQAGGYDADYEPLPEGEPIRNEADNGASNEAGTIAMARTLEDPHSATNQFFINLDDNWSLDHSSETRLGWGFCVFGEVVAGFEVAEAIGEVEIGAAGPFEQDAPLEPVVIERMYRLERTRTDTEKPQ